MNAKTKDATLEASADGDDALLNQYEFSELPAVFSLRNQDNSIVQEREPSYLCRADGFYGKGTAGTWYEEGSIIVTDAVPNVHMEPLNRAAAIRYARWLDHLPKNQIPVDMGDISEAMTMLAARPDFLTMTPDQRSEAAMKFAVRLKLKREGRDARDLPVMGHNFAPQSGGKAPPILGAKMADMNQRGPGQTSAAAVIPAGHSAGARRATSVPPAALGGQPPQH